MMARVASLLFGFVTSGLGFILSSLLAGWGVLAVCAALPVDKVAEAARYVGVASALIVNLHLFVKRQLYDLRDVEELSTIERTSLRAIVHLRTTGLWGWIVTVMLLGVVGALAPWMPEEFGKWAAQLALMGAFWTLYSLLLIPRWSAEIASFKSMIADRKRDREARDAALKELTENIDGWKHVNDLDAYLKLPE